MRRLIAITGVLYALITPSLAADLEEALRIVGSQPAKALSMAREALATDPHRVEAHVVAIKALKMMGRADEAISPLEAWSAEAPDAFPPLWMLFDLRAGMNDWAAVATLAARAPAQPETERRKFLQAIVLAQLENERYVEAASTLTITPAPLEGEPLADAFAALAGSAVGDWSTTSLTRFLTSGVDEATQNRFLWWTAQLERIADSKKSGESVSEVAGGLVGKEPDSDRPKPLTHDVKLPTLKIKVDAEYPEEARANGIEGKVTVQAIT